MGLPASTRVHPLLDTVAIETTPNNWNRNNQPTLQSNQKQLIVKLSELVRMRKSQDFSPTTKVLRMICVPVHKSHTSSNALHVLITKITPEKCVEHLNCAVLTNANQELTCFAVKPLTHRHRNHLFCRTWPTTKRTQSKKNESQTMWPPSLSETHAPNLEEQHFCHFQPRANSIGTQRNVSYFHKARNTMKRKNAQLRLSYRTVMGCSSSSSA